MTSGYNPLTYPANSNKPVKRIYSDRAPTTNDRYNVRLGDEWLDRSANKWYKLASLANRTATWISMTGASDNFLTDDGNTVTPDINSDVTLTGALVDNATNATPLFTDGAIASTVRYEIQKSTAVASGSKDPNLCGLAHFDSTSFAVDSDGFVTLVGGGIAIDTLTADTGGAISPDGAGNINVLGGSNFNTAGAGNTITFNLDTSLVGLTSVEVGNITISGGTIATTAMNNDITIDPHGSGNIILTTTAGGQIDLNNLSVNSNTISSTNTNGDISLSPDGTGTVNISYATQYAIPYFEASGAIDELTPLTNGQLVIGSTGAAPAPATLTAGAGISIANGAGSITIAATGSGFAWADASGAIAVTSNAGYFITATSTATLPASPTNGDAVSFIVDTTDILTITANTGQTIRIGTAESASAGTCVSTARGDALALVYRATTQSWIADSGVQGTWTIT